MKKLFVLNKCFYVKIFSINYSEELRVFMNELYTTSEAAQDLQISQKRVIDLIHSGILEAEKIAGIWFINADSVYERRHTVNKSGGRPKIGEGKFEESYTLYNREFPCIELIYDDEEKRFKKIVKILDRERCPIWLLDKHGEIYLSTFNLWWRFRGIPNERDNIHEILEKEGVKVPEELIKRNLGLSLSDQYWLQPKGASLKWENINFFNHNFVSSKFTGEEGKYLSDSHPNNTSDGNLEKYWTIENDQRILCKAGSKYVQEPFNEVIATKFFEEVLEEEDYVKYWCEDIKGRAFSKCKEFLKDDEEYVSAYYVMETLKKPNHINNYQHYVNLATDFGVKNIETFLSKMIVCDFALMNYDRHFRNFGLVRNVHDLTWRVAPIFDTGSSLLCDADDYDLKHRLYTYETKPFYKKARRQLLLAEDLSWLSADKLDKLPNIITEVLSINDQFKKRLPEIIYAVKQHIEIIKFLI